MTCREGTSAFREEVVRFGHEEGLAGILTTPEAVPAFPAPIPVLILGAGIIHKVGPSRISVKLARALAAWGHSVLRFDLSGIGDSQRSGLPSLDAAVTNDIRAAVGLLDEAVGARGRVALVGFCSGADNGFHVAGLESRVRAVAMFDPTVHRTKGFYRRQALGRLLSTQTWLNILSGRSLWLRVKKGLTPEVGRRPPGYYGLLVRGPEETEVQAARLVERGVHLLYCLSSGARGYCNSPGQVRESLPTAYSDEYMTVAWRPDLDHILSERSQREAFVKLVREWLASVTS